MVAMNQIVNFDIKILHTEITGLKLIYLSVRNKYTISQLYHSSHISEHFQLAFPIENKNEE